MSAMTTILEIDPDAIRSNDGGYFPAVRTTLAGDGWSDVSVRNLTPRRETPFRTRGTAVLAASLILRLDPEA